MDEFLKMLFETVANESRQTPPRSGNPFNMSFDIEKEATKTAKLTRTLYDAFVKEGFTPEQAMTFTVNIITPKR